MRRQENSRLWRDVNILCQLLGHLLSDLANKGGFVGRVGYAENFALAVKDTYCGWADARVKYEDVWKQYWGESVLPRSKRADIERYYERMRSGELTQLPPIMVCVYDDGVVTVDGGRRCAALMKLTPEERARVVMPAFIIDLRADDCEKSGNEEREHERAKGSFVETLGG